MSRADVVLLFVGPRVSGAPARDLRHSDIERIAYRRAFAKTAADGVRPPRPTSEDIRSVTADLVARGRYRKPPKET
jgi:hypothetical protein